MARHKPEAEAPIPQLDDRVAELPPLDNAPSDATTDAAAPSDAAEPPPPKRRRRRRKVQPEAEPVAEDVSPEERNFAQALALGFQFGGDIVAGMRGQHWKFQPDEVNMLGDVWAKALHPYMGQLAPYTPFIVATIVTAGVMMPRVQTDRLIRAGEIQPIHRHQPLSAPVREVAPADNDSVPGMEPPPAQADSIGGKRGKRKGEPATEYPPGIS